MDYNQKLAVYQAQVKNVRALESSIKHVRRAINAGLRANDQPMVLAFTNTYAILFCAWAEANFSKLLHTPHGFEIPEIEQVQLAKDSGIAAAWKKAVELGLRHLSAQRGSFKPNARQKLYNLIDGHVFDPSLLRNKFAHGQWVIALNRTNTAVQTELTTLIGELDIVKIDAWMASHRQLALLVENLIESPEKVFPRDWYTVVATLEEQIDEAEKRTLADHVAVLVRKDTSTGARTKRATARGGGGQTP
jgi:hypothetical protein